MIRMYFSGTEDTKDALELARRGIKHQLVSYLYLRDKAGNISRFLRQRRDAGINMFLDSGGFTYRKHAPGGVGYKRNDPECYVRTPEFYQGFVDDYIKFLNKYKHYFDTFVNMDLNNVVGNATVERWNKEIEDGTGQQPLVVWHNECGFKKIEEYAQTYNYIGFGRGTRMHTRARIYRAGRINKTKIHGFALTDYASMSRWPFYSVDSTSWKAGSMYGLTYYFTGRKLSQSSKKGQRKKWKFYCDNNEIDFKKFIKDHGPTANMFNACQWRDFVNHVNSYKHKIGMEYWN